MLKKIITIKWEKYDKELGLQAGRFALKNLRISSIDRSERDREIE